MPDQSATAAPTGEPPDRPAGAGGDRPTSQLLAALEACWAAIGQRHPELPAAVVVVGAGSDRRKGLWKWGHFAAMRWRPRQASAGAGDALPEVLVAGEGLERPALEVVETLLHEAAHAIANRRRIADTSRGGRYHNRRYRTVAEELGLDVAEQPPYGHARTTMSPATTKLYAAAIAELAAALVLYRVAEATPGRHGRGGGGVTAGGDQDGQGHGQHGEDLDDDEAGDDGGRLRRDSNLLPAVCACGRRIRIAPSVLIAGPVTCGLCGAEFAAAPRPDIA
jgi:hypothetical protein